MLLDVPYMLFADFGDIARLIFLVLFFVGPALFKAIFGGEQQEAAKPKPRPRPQPRPIPGQPPQNPADRLESEIEAFLRRAADPQADQKPVDAVVIEPKPKTGAKPLTARSESAMTERSRLGGGVADHVEQHIKSNPVTGDAARLGRSVSNEVDRMESHVHDVFDHTIGRLKETVPSVTNEKADIDDRGTDSSVWEDMTVRKQRAADEKARRKAELIQMLRSPTNIRQAIIMSEVLKRPSFDNE